MRIPVTFEQPVRVKDDSPPIDYGYYYKTFDSGFYNLGPSITWFTVPDKAWHVMGISYLVNTGATVGNRLFQARFRDVNQNAIWETLTSPQVPTSTYFVGRAVPGVGSDEGYLSGPLNTRRYINMGLPSPFVLFAGYSFSLTDLQNIEAADVSQIKVYYRREVF